MELLCDSLERLTNCIEAVKIEIYCELTSWDANTGNLEAVQERVHFFEHRIFEVVSPANYRDNHVAHGILTGEPPDTSNVCVI